MASMFPGQVQDPSWMYASGGSAPRERGQACLPNRWVRDNDPRVRFGIVTDQNLPFSTLAERWQLFERLGFHSA